MESLLVPAVIGVLGLVLGFLVGRYAGGRSELAPRTTAELAGMRQEAEEVVSERIEERKQRILAAARTAGRITNDGVEELFCISDSTARRYLNELEGERKLAQRGEGGGTYYVPVE